MILDILNMPESRFIQVYIVQGMLGLMFLYISYLILKRDTKRLNIIFAGLYICTAAGIFINFIYAPLTDETAVLWLNFATNYLFAYASVFLVVFDLMLLKSEKVINTSKQILILVLYATVLLGLLIFILQDPPGVTINASTGWRPVYGLPFYLYLIIAFIGLSCIPTLYLSIQIYHKFEDDMLKRKWRFFMVGIILIYSFAIGTFTMNYLNNDMLRTVWALLSLIFSISGPLMVYYGVGKQLSQSGREKQLEK